MILRNTNMRYGIVTKFLHWLLALLILGQITYGYLLDSIPKDLQAISYNIHKLIGLSIFVLMLLRALWTLANPKPLLPLSTRLWEHILERFVQFLIYASILSMAIAGWIGSVAAGRAPHLENIIFSLPITPNKALAGFAMDIHRALAYLVISLLLLHICAAFFHYFYKKDNVLQRMLPGSY